MSETKDFVSFGHNEYAFHFLFARHEIVNRLFPTNNCWILYDRLLLFVVVYNVDIHCGLRLASFAFKTISFDFYSIPDTVKMYKRNEVKCDNCKNRNGSEFN